MDFSGEDRIEVLHVINIPGGDTRFPVSVEVERRTSCKNGKEHTYVNLIVAVGKRRLFIPRRVSREVAHALDKAAGIASDEYAELLELKNTAGPGRSGVKGRRQDHG